MESSNQSLSLIPFYDKLYLNDIEVNNLKQLGQVFKRLREARHISLSEASGDEFSPSMLSKFESGKNDISAQKLLTALENTHIEINEYLYLVRGFSESQLVRLQNGIQELELNNDYNGLNNMYNSEIKKIAKNPNHQNYKINSLIIKAHMKGLDDTIQLSKEEEHFLYDYLFNTEIWGNYELTLFAISSTLISPELFTKYTREMLHKTDFLGLLNENKSIIKTLLINGFLLCIEKEDFVNAGYFDKHIQEHFFKENEAYYRIIYLWAKGLLDYKQNRQSDGIEQMRQAISILKILNCYQAANYYQKALEKEIAKKRN